MIKKTELLITFAFAIAFSACIISVKISDAFQSGFWGVLAGILFCVLIKYEDKSEGGKK